MIEHSHPEKDEREGAVRACDKVIRAQMVTLRELPEWSNNVIAKKIGMNVAVVSQYLNDSGCKYPGDIKRLEAKFTDLLENEARRRASGVDTTDCDSAGQIKTALEYIRKTNDVGIILDDSGDGKTRGLEFYAKEHPTAIFYRTFAWSCAKKSAESFMFDVAGQSDYDNRTPRTVHAVKKLRGSERLIILDDAHFLHHTALQWWIHFHEATQMPLAVAGTYALLKKIEADPQIFSRVGLRFEVKKLDAHGKLKIDRTLIKHLIGQLVPNINGEENDLADLCEQVAKEHGHYRSVHKQLKVAVELKSAEKKLSWIQAFKSAHTMLIRNYQLA